MQGVSVGLTEYHSEHGVENSVFGIIPEFPSLSVFGDSVKKFICFI